MVPFFYLCAPLHGSNTHTFTWLTYLEYYAHFHLQKYDKYKNTRTSYFVEQENNQQSPCMHVVQRTKKTTHLTRIHHVQPSHGDIFYLRTILQTWPVLSFTDARMIGDTMYDTFQDAVR